MEYYCVIKKIYRRFYVYFSSEKETKYAEYRRKYT